MAQFYLGLKDEVKDELVKANRPNNLATYMAMAIRIDERQYERRRERKNQGWVWPKKDKKPKDKPSTSYGSQRGPMELDATQRDSKKKDKWDWKEKKNQRYNDGKCYNCDKAGYFVRECR